MRRREKGGPTAGVQERLEGISVPERRGNEKLLDSIILEKVA